ncbi:hypothetical protein QBC33DRAFT_558926 [Phialemonium atrogriseum]|uniref:Protein kinase domain-containing protein n=1 Tax=Phialemonium atrogriseum TaxID=1093897 RepID=A0AAJ0C0V4_9PEZI|nr:uncharacterized protein QBC33DRAFT_558926 [Phialemonium atrogriseum]KAK1767447.1 hypothetical protein QBC33DRAFT_558926 [Phialemonium atrogriseum]
MPPAVQPDLPPRMREVRMILIDQVPGTTMESLITKGCVKNFESSLRVEILGKAMEKYTWLTLYGVFQHNLAPRNIMISKDLLQVTLIDPSHAHVLGLPNSVGPLRTDRERPLNPIDLFNGAWDNEWLPWIPEEYRSYEAFREWMQTRWGDSKEFEPPYP